MALKEGKDGKDASFVKLNKNLHPTNQGEISTSVFFVFYLFIPSEAEKNFSNSLQKD